MKLLDDLFISRVHKGWDKEQLQGCCRTNILFILMKDADRPQELVDFLRQLYPDAYIAFELDMIERRVGYDL